MYETAVDNNNINTSCNFKACTTFILPTEGK